MGDWDPFCRLGSGTGPDLFEEGVVGGFADGGMARSSMATSAGDTFVEHEDPLVNPLVNG